MNNLLTFFDSETQAKKAKLIGFIALLCALFLAIDRPADFQAANALAIVQVFWLIVLTLGLGSLFIDFFKFVWSKERILNSTYDLPFNFVISGSLALILTGVVLNLWIYTFAMYSNLISVFIILFGFPLLVASLCVLGAMFAKIYEEKLPLIILLLLESLIIGCLAMVSGLYLEYAVTKQFQLDWFFPRTPGTALVVLAALVFISLYRGKDLLKPWTDEEGEDLQVPMTLQDRILLHRD